MGADELLRRLERAWRESQSDEDERAYLLALGRTRPLLRHDGLYYAASAQQWLRLFPGGHAASVRSAELDPARVAPWLTPDHPHCAGGTYRCVDLSLELALGPEQGTLAGSSLRGRLRPEDRLDLVEERGAGEAPRAFAFRPLDPALLPPPFGLA